MKLSLILIVFLIAFSARSQSIVTDRPGQSDASTTIPKNTFQMEMGFYMEQTGNNSQAIQMPVSLFRFSVVKGVEFRVLSKVISDKSISPNIGFDNLELGTKIQLLGKEDSKTYIAFEQHVNLPTGTASDSVNNVGLTSKLLLSQQLTDNLTLISNLGYNYGNGTTSDFFYTLNFSYGLNDKFGLFFENYGGFTDGKNFTTSMDSGFAFLVNDNLQFDLAFGVGITEQMNYIGFGVSWRVAK